MFDNIGLSEFFNYICPSVLASKLERFYVTCGTGSRGIGVFLSTPRD